jgi:hypothetical protein
MPARKVHYSYVSPSLTIPVCCDRTALWKGTRPDRKPLTSTDPRHVACLRCLRIIVRLTHVACLRCLRIIVRLTREARRRQERAG